MRIITSLTAAALVVALAGCVGVHKVDGTRAVGPFISTKHDCKETSPPTTCSVVVDPGASKWVPDVLVVYGKSDRDITFELVPGYEFLPNNGIAMDAPDTKIKCDYVRDNPRQFACKYKYKRDAFGVHKYTINAKAGGTLLPPYDPFFINE